MSTASTEKITVLLADDHPAFRKGIRAMLEETNDIEVVGEAQDGFEVQKLVAQLQPRILLLDLKMPGMEPRPAALEEWVRENYPYTDTLILTAHDRDNYLSEMIDAGVVGYLSKTQTSERLINAIRRAVKGELLFDSSQILRAKQWRIEIKEKINQLTPKEKETLKMVAKGLDNKGIACSMDVSVKTVSYHMTNIMLKLEVKSRQEAAIWALKYLSDDLDVFPG